MSSLLTTRGRFQLRFMDEEIPKISKGKKIVIESNKIHEVLHYLKRKAMIKSIQDSILLTPKLLPSSTDLK